MAAEGTMTCTCDWETGECQAPMGCKRAESLVERIKRLEKQSDAFQHACLKYSEALEIRVVENSVLRSQSCEIKRLTRKLEH
jgi:hypothetical protein